MKNILKIVLFFQILIQAQFIFADEGMWLPLFLGQTTYDNMVAKGLKLSLEEIYSINHSSLKDAVVLFGGGCSAGIISDKGLIITNHHCGFGQIQNHSTLEHNYLENGFWAMSQNEELINQNLTVTFLIKMEDVTDSVLYGTSFKMDEKKRSEIISKNISKIVVRITNNSNLQASVRPFYYGNQYILMITKEYKDIRLVGAPPTGIGKFGGDTDNWMWPRHTGDFSLFRIYADKNNEPSVYKPDNVPYIPEKSFTISLKGVEEGDFTMVYGFPARTQEYVTSYAIELLTEIENPIRISIRNEIINIINNGMSEDKLTRIQYSSKVASLANGWKKWIGENNGLNRLNTKEKKQKIENDFSDWIKNDSIMYEKYGKLLSDFKQTYKDLKIYSKAMQYYREGAFGSDIIKFVMNFEELAEIKKDINSDDLNKLLDNIKLKSSSFFKNYNAEIEKEIFLSLLKIIDNNIDNEFKPEFFSIIHNKYKGDYIRYTNEIFKKTLFAQEKNVQNLLNSFTYKSVKKLTNDPIYIIAEAYLNIYNEKIKNQYNLLNDNVMVLNRYWMSAQMEMLVGKHFYPDANSTLRISYGQVENYFPRDGIQYKAFTTINGIMEKASPEIYDYVIPHKLQELYENKDYGVYSKNNDLRICFIATNHTSGGNSGSPVLNAQGELIGVNFDRNWEGTMSDVEYDPEMCRNIVLDIRYALFIIEKYAGATNLINELKISLN